MLVSFTRSVFARLDLVSSSGQRALVGTAHCDCVFINWFSVTIVDTCFLNPRQQGGLPSCSCCDFFQPMFSKLLTSYPDLYGVVAGTLTACSSGPW
jgi:hypothetical protein